MLFIKKTEVCCFTDNTSINSSSLNYEEAHQKLSNDTNIVLNWFRINNMVANPGKFQKMFFRSHLQ